LLKSIGLLTGFVFFGDPVIWHGIAYLNDKYPNWQRLLELQKYVEKPIHTVMFTNRSTAPSSKGFQPMLN
jgi:hypothetical protein